MNYLKKRKQQPCFIKRSYDPLRNVMTHINDLWTVRSCVVKFYLINLLEHLHSPKYLMYILYIIWGSFLIDSSYFCTFVKAIFCYVIQNIYHFYVHLIIINFMIILEELFFLSFINASVVHCQVVLKYLYFYYCYD